jgi:hypothetical protein
LPKGVGGLIGYSEIGVFENMSYLSNERAVILKGYPFLGWLSGWCIVAAFCCDFLL